MPTRPAITPSCATLALPRFKSNTAARLAEIFVAQRRDNVDLSGVAVIDPQLSLLPQIEANGMMRMAGFFPSVPTQVNFELTYAPVNGQWRLFGISVNLGSSAPVAPAPPPAPASAAKKCRSGRGAEGRTQVTRPGAQPGGTRRKAYTRRRGPTMLYIG